MQEEIKKRYREIRSELEMVSDRIIVVSKEREELTARQWKLNRELEQLEADLLESFRKECEQC